MARHLTNSNGAKPEEVPVEGDGQPAVADEAKKKPLAVEDYQLNEALNVLKALTIFSASRDNTQLVTEDPAQP